MSGSGGALAPEPVVRNRGGRVCALRLPRRDAEESKQKRGRSPKENRKRARERERESERERDAKVYCFCDSTYADPQESLHLRGAWYDSKLLLMYSWPDLKPWEEPTLLQTILLIKVPITRN